MSTFKQLRYWIRRADYSSTDYGPVDVTGAIRAFTDHDWTAEQRLLAEMEQAGRESGPPGIGLVDADGRILHICPGADGRALVHYHSKVATKAFGFIRTTKDVDYTREGIERSVVIHFIRCFFDARSDVIESELTDSK